MRYILQIESEGTLTFLDTEKVFIICRPIKSMNKPEKIKELYKRQLNILNNERFILLQKK